MPRMVLERVGRLQHSMARGAFAGSPPDTRERGATSQIGSRHETQFSVAPDKGPPDEPREGNSRRPHR